MRARAVSLPLCLILVLQWTLPAGSARASAAGEPSLLIKLSAPSVPEEQARERMKPMPQLLLRDLGVSWVHIPDPPSPPELSEAFPDADDASIESVSKLVASALKHMERMETGEAGLLLEKAEEKARGFRLGESTRALFAEIFLRRGLLKLWEGDVPAAEDMFARSRVMRPGFSPDPGLFSPAFRDAWTRSGMRQAPEVELLLQSIPPGAGIYVDGRMSGTTPGRIRISSAGPVRIRLSLPGFIDAETAGQWLPGDSESLERVLARDRIATLGELLASQRDGKGSGRLLADLASAAGASRVGILVLEDRGGKAVARLYSAGAEGADPAFLGEFEWPSGEDGVSESARLTSGMLISAGWPAAPTAASETGSSWYDKLWVWVLIGAVLAGMAAGAGGGGGGSSGGSTGSIGVSF